MLVTFPNILRTRGKEYNISCSLQEILHDKRDKCMILTFSTTHKKSSKILNFINSSKK